MHSEFIELEFLIRIVTTQRALANTSSPLQTRKESQKLYTVVEIALLVSLPP